jgi:hypothetical protein
MVGPRKAALGTDGIAYLLPNVLHYALDRTPLRCAH